MQKLNSYITERYVNLFSRDVDQRKQYVDDVWELLQTTYAKIGGIKGSGFESKEAMIQKIPLWKLVRKDGKIVAGSLYKDKDGRKRVASFTDRSPEGIKALASIMKEDFGRAYFEISKGSLKLAVDSVGYDFILQYAKSIDEVKKLLPKDEIRLPPSDDSHVQKFGKLRNYFYQREFGGSWETKIMLGTSGNKIINNGDSS
jgi:hypothetical protein